MAGMAVLRAGAGLSTVATAKSVLATVGGFHPELMTEPLAETETGSISLAALDPGRLDALVKGKTVLAIGPGISRHPDTSAFVRGVIKKYAMQIVLDRAVARGEIDPGRLSPRIASLPLDLVRHDLIMNRSPVPDPALIEIVDRVFLPLLRGEPGSGRD